MGLSPAFDLTYSFNPTGAWTATHQMTMNGKREGFTREDFAACAKAVGMKRGRSEVILDAVIAAVKDWPRFAAQAKLEESTMRKIERTHLLDFPKQ